DLPTLVAGRLKLRANCRQDVACRHSNRFDQDLALPAPGVFGERLAIVALRRLERQYEASALYRTAERSRRRGAGGRGSPVRIVAILDVARTRAILATARRKQDCERQGGNKSGVSDHLVGLWRWEWSFNPDGRHCGI